MKRNLRLGAAIGALGLIAAACSSPSHGAASGAKPTTPMAEGGMSSTTMMAEGGMSSTTMMALPAYAMSWKTSLASPADGTTVTGNSLDVAVNTSGYQLSCDWAGKADQSNYGHYHLSLDGSLINMFCTPQATISMQNVQPGMHKLMVVPALNDHSEVMDNGQTITFNYQPTNPLPPLTAASFPGPATIKIVSPTEGQTVSGSFTVQVQITNFNPSCELYGKKDVPGYGHWHVNWDTTSGGMMGMATMAGMSCTTTMQLSTVGLTPGSHHKVIAFLADDLHAMEMPNVSDSVDITVGG